MAINNHRFVKTALMLALLALPSAAKAQTVRYIVVPLAKTSAQTDCVPTAVTPAGDVVGYCNSGALDSLAVVWRNGAVEPLGKLPDGVFSKALAINPVGVIVGEGDTGDLIGKAIVHRNGQWIEIDGSGGSYQAAQGITDAGVIFGRFSSAGHPGIETEDPVFWVFDPAHDRYDRFDLPKATGTPSTGFSGASVFAASRFGIAVGGVSTDIAGNRGAVWMNDGAHTLIVLAKPADRPSAVASAVSDDGHAVGWAFSGVQPPAPLDDRAVMWLNDAARTLVAIGTLPGDAWSRAFGVNNAGQVVGASYTLANVPRGFIFEDGTLSDLTALLDPASADWIIGETAGITNEGIIIATGRRNGEFHPLMLIPTAAPADTLAPDVALTSPVSGSTVTGQVSIAATATDNVAVTHVVFFADGQPLGQSNGPSYSVTWDTASSPDGTVVLTARAFDAAGNQAESAAVQVTVANHVDVTPPSVSVPASITAEATGQTGAAVTFAASASDAVDGSVPVSCRPPSGSMFALGTTTVTCTASDAAGNTASAAFSILIQDTTAPAVSVPADITQEATAAAGAAVTFAVSATDAVDGGVAVTCNPSSGSMFAVGSTSVNCSATDAAGNLGTASFAVTVQDTTAPVILVPSNIAVQASGPVPVNFTVSASDSVDGVVAVTCNPQSGSSFPLGSTTVNCQATDAHGNNAVASFVVQVQRPADTTAPVLTLPSTIRAKATGAGMVINYTATALDNVDGEVAVTCTPQSGSLFLKGKTTVSCTATDSSGNVARGSFVVQLTGSGKN